MHELHVLMYAHVYIIYYILMYCRYIHVHMAMVHFINIKTCLRIMETDV